MTPERESLKPNVAEASCRSDTDALQSKALYAT